jgi:hypothetical protein
VRFALLAVGLALAVLAVGGFTVAQQASSRPCKPRFSCTTTTTTTTTTSATAPTTTTTTTGTVGTYDEAVLADQPVAYWRMAGSLTEPDATSNGHTGSYINGTPGAATMPNGDPARDFNGAWNGNYMSVPSSPEFSIPATHTLTVEAWIRPDTLAPASATADGYTDFAGKCLSGSQFTDHQCEWEGRLYAAVTPEGRCNRFSGYAFNPQAGSGSAADWQPSPCSVVQAGRWYHVVVSYQTLSTPWPCEPAYPGTIEIWVNGVKWRGDLLRPTGCISQYKVIPVAGSAPLNVGTMGLDSWFAGAIGKVAIYDYQLPDARVAAHYTAMTGAAPTGTCTTTCNPG